MATERSDIQTRLRESTVGTGNAQIVETMNRRYDAGFITDIETEFAPPGLSEDIIRFISNKKEEPSWMTDWRLAAYRHWQTMSEPHWAKLRIAPIDLQALSYYAAPKNRPKSLAEVDPKLLEVYEKLGVPLHERAKLAGVAVDAVFDSVSVGTTFRKELAEAGVIFCSMSEAVREFPELVRQYLGTVVRPATTISRRSLGGVSTAARVIRRACAVQLSCRPTSASMPAIPDVRAHVIIAEKGASVS